MNGTNRIGEFEQLALLAVMRLGDEAYGARIQEELERTAGREASVSAIYITLTRLEGKGLVASRMGEPTEVRGGKARRYFRVEPGGVAALNEARDRLLSMWDGLEREIEGAGISAK
ncbi:MAG TPA: helix-turn-helix transcriptional regulator [Longimicrobiales bacterium]|jgi:DNA-binding PadR family transcriptional regulator